MQTYRVLQTVGLLHPLAHATLSLANYLTRLPRESWRRNRVLTATAGALLLVVLPALLLLAQVDHRLVWGQNTWVKPIKFTVSLSLYFLTVAWLLSYLPRTRSVTVISWITALAILLETPILVLQAARGVPSHFNTTTPWDATLFYLMGAAAFTQVGMLAWTLRLYCQSPVALPPLVAQGARLGMATLILGMFPGLAMVALGHHSVGADDGGAGLPIVHWNTAGGDLRIAHFLGLHAIQVLPLAGLAFARVNVLWGTRLSQPAFQLVAALYVLMLLGTFAQALWGQPLLPVASVAYGCSSVSGILIAPSTGLLAPSVYLAPISL